MGTDVATKTMQGRRMRLALAIGALLLVGGWAGPRLLQWRAAQLALDEGEAALAQGDVARALTIFGRAQERFPSEPRLARAIARGRATFLAAGLDRVPHDGLDEIAAAIDKLLAEEPRNPTWLTARALVAWKAGDQARAKTRLDQAVAADPKSGIARRAQARLLIADHQLEAAISTLERVLADDPNDGQALFDLAACAQAIGRRDLAKATYERILAMPLPTTPWARTEAAARRESARGRLEGLAQAAP